MFTNVKRLFILFLLGCAFTTHVHAANYSKVSFSKGISVEIPLGWSVASPSLKQQMRIAVETTTEFAGYPLPSGQNHVLLYARSLPEESFASVTINLDTPASFPQQQVLIASVSDLAAYTAKTRPIFEKLLSAQGEKIVSFEDVRRISVQNYPALVTEYTRTGVKGNVRVQIIQVIMPEKDVSITLSYRISERALWSPIIEKIRSTFRVKEAKL